MRALTSKTFFTATTAAIALLSGAGTAMAQTAETDQTAEVDEIVVTAHYDPLGRLQKSATDSFTGLDRSMYETPRSVSRVSMDTIDSYGMENVDDLDGSGMVEYGEIDAAFGKSGNTSNIRQIREYGGRQNPKFALDEGVGTVKLSHRDVMADEVDYNETQTFTASTRVRQRPRAGLQGLYGQGREPTLQQLRFCRRL